ncbi:MAG: 4-hydroxythreonine-4-phosphate dehydrogenase PdxA [Opitutaceae bacterium]|nr:4-hydroxythreonine-4-phosphate dehydrogenase PdxA [Opitutaceae bacterium]
MSNTSLPIIALTLGDPAGIGPELAVKLVARKDLMGQARVVVVGDEWVWEDAQRLTGLRFNLSRIDSFADPRIVSSESPLFLPTQSVQKSEIVPSIASAAGGKSVLQVLRFCIAAAIRGELDAICFAPLNKLAMKMGGLGYDDELHMFAHELGVKGYFCEFNVLGQIWTSRITSHIPLRDVATTIDKNRVKDATRLIYQALLQAGFAKPRIAVAALNPHAGEGGTCGREEIDVIAPAIRECQAEGIIAEGPYSADTIFLKARAHLCDAIVTMYHDQGQIALKLMGFEKGVTVQGGLPIIITTPAHGTAFDIVGQNRANPGAIAEAFGLAVRMAAHVRRSKIAAKPA